MFSDELNRLTASPPPAVRKLIRLLEPVSDGELEAMAQEARNITRRYFGNAMRLFAPIYVSNECINNCKYCGFSRDNPIIRTTLTVDEVEREARYLYERGVRSLLLVAGEHPKFVSDGYLQEILDRLRPFIPSLGLEIGPLPDDRYAEIVKHGAELLTVFQETYDKAIYETLHTAGLKKNFEWRLNCPERAYMGGFRRIGIGALFGIAPWKQEAIALACHADYLLKHCWKAQLSISFPRMRPHAGNYEYTPDDELMLDDRRYVQLMCALRICFPHVGFVVSTRETPEMRRHLMNIAVTCMSCCAKTEPGGYTGAGFDRAHVTRHGVPKALSDEERRHCTKATEQFAISDERTVEEFVADLKRQGLDPVWKDWDDALNE